MSLDVRARTALRCPKCRAEVVEVGEALLCTSGECRLSFPVRDGIPLMLVDEAAMLPAEEWQTIIAAAEATGTAAYHRGES